MLKKLLYSSLQISQYLGMRDSTKVLADPGNTASRSLLSHFPSQHTLRYTQLPLFSLRPPPAPFLVSCPTCPRPLIPFVSAAADCVSSPSQENAPHEARAPLLPAFPLLSAASLARLPCLSFRRGIGILLGRDGRSRKLMV